MRIKTFDSVEMQHRGGDRVREHTAGMTPEQWLTFWSERTRMLRERQQAARQARDGGAIRLPWQ
jgi:hypothetical protein